MRYSFFAVIAAILLQACNTPAPKPASAKAAADSSAVMDTVMPGLRKDFSRLVFVNKKDLVCHMPLTAGIGDTATYKGNLYGFCSPECKQAFEKDAAAYVAKSK